MAIPKRFHADTQFKKASRWWFRLFEENNISKHNRIGQRGSNRTQPLTSGIFIVSREQLTPFLDAILNAFHYPE